MKTHPTTNPHAERKWTVAELPQEHPSDLTELEIYVNYTEQGNAAKGCAIDHYVVPLFRLAPRLLEVVAGYTGLGLATLGLTPEELVEVKRLTGKPLTPSSDDDNQDTE